ncbi:hypothetical protein TNCT_404531, partial [Trichonephila clavata]
MSHQQITLKHCLNNNIERRKEKSSRVYNYIECLQVRRKSKAHKRLLEGDLILSVNGHSCQNLTYDQVMEIADKSGTDLTLEIL